MSEAVGERPLQKGDCIPAASAMGGSGYSGYSGAWKAPDGAPALCGKPRESGRRNIRALPEERPKDIPRAADNLPARRPSRTTRSTRKSCCTSSCCGHLTGQHQILSIRPYTSIIYFKSQYLPLFGKRIPNIGICRNMEIPIRFSRTARPLSYGAKTLAYRHSYGAAWRSRTHSEL